MSDVDYQTDVRVLHIEPVTHQEVQVIQQHSPPDVSKLEGIVATSELFKHRDLDATLAVHATEMKHDDRFHFHWYFTIITLVAILLTILICNGYPYLLRNLLYRICCTKQPVVNPTLGDKSQSLPETFPEEQPCTSQLQFNEKEKKSEFVTYSAQTEAWSWIYQTTLQPTWKAKIDYFSFFETLRRVKNQETPNAGGRRSATLEGQGSEVKVESYDSKILERSYDVIHVNMFQVKCALKILLRA